MNLALKRFCLVIIVILAGVHCLSFWQYTVEDAYISFRYARNWATGNGLVYNVNDRVEGYSNFGWVALTALTLKLGLEPVEAMKRIGLTLGLLTIVLAFLGTCRRNHWSGLIAPFWLACSSAYALWSVAGLETPLFTALVTAAWVSALRVQSHRGLVLSGSFFGLAGLTRPEAPFFVGCYAAGILAADRSRPGLKRALLLGAVFLVWFTPYLLFRYWYYEDLLPNTYYVKSVRFLGSGATYLWRSLPVTGVIPLLFIPLAIIKRRNAHILGLTLTVVGGALYVLYQGGDWMPMARFLVPLLPAVVLLGSEGLAELAVLMRPRLSSTKTGAILIMLILIASVIGVRSARRNILRWEIKLHDDWRAIGTWFQQNTPPETTLATGLGGIIPYYADRTNYDNGGLTNKAIAQMIRQSATLEEERVAVDLFIMSLEPDYYLIPNIIQLWPEPLTNPETLDWPLLRRLEFHRGYRLVNIQISNKFFAVFKRVQREVKGLRIQQPNLLTAE